MADAAAADSPGAALRRCPPRGRIDVRGDAADPAFAAAVAGVVGAAPPTEANTARSAARAVVLWLGPDEWLVEVAAAAENEVARALESALAGFHASVAVVGDASAALSLAGPRAADVLAKGMTLDLAPDRFRPGHCARSLLAKVPVLLHRPGPDLVYEITVARSFADYARCWLEDAALEYRRAS